MSLKSAISLFLIGAFGAGLAACGGGSVSSGGAGGGTGGTGANSSLVVKAPQTASAPWMQQGPQSESRLASAVSDFLIGSAVAQSDEDVYLLSSSGELVATGTSDASGQVIFPVSSGEYFICIGAPDLDTGTCTETTQSVGDNEVVVVTLELVEDTLVIASTEVESAEDNIVAFQDPDAAHKTLVCHQAGPFKQFTISVGTPAAQSGHMAHGDTLGACPEEDPEEVAGSDDPDSTDDDSVDDGDDDDSVDSAGGGPGNGNGPPPFANNG